jgi:branched-chain amino acid transport system substrate-binding protein
MPSRHRLLSTTALLALIGLGVAACSDSSKSTTTAPATNQATEQANALPDRIATGEPIVLGFINNEGGAAFSVPELTVGSQVAVDYVNNKLNGVNGRPLKVVRCTTDGSPEKSIDCANKLIEQKVVAIQEGTDLGADAILPILAAANVPLVGHVQFGAARMFDKNSWYFGTAAIAYGGAALSFYKSEGAKSVAWFLPDQPSSRAFTDGVLMPTAQALGLTYKTVYYDATNPNWSVLATTAVADNPDVSGTIAASDGQCAELVSALKDAGYQGRILAASCAQLGSAIGAKATGVEIDFDHWNPAGDPSAPSVKQDEIKLYTSLMNAAGKGDLANGNALITFSDTVVLQHVLSTITGEINGTSVANALQATKGHDAFAGPKITCDHSVIPGNSACFGGLLFYQVQADGTLKSMTTDFVSGVLA